MATEAQQLELIEKYGQPIREEVIPCVTGQWNFPHPKDQPWVKDGRCTICGQNVEGIRVGPDSDDVYSHIATPHSRVLRWFAIDADDLRDYIDHVERY